MSRHEPQIVLIAGVWLAAAAAANAATESTSQPAGLEEVIVTAQKRSESEQTVLCADRRWRRHCAHHIDPRYLRRQRHRLLYR